jgi:hypothetical protein
LMSGCSIRTPKWPAHRPLPLADTAGSENNAMDYTTRASGSVPHSHRPWEKTLQSRSRRVEILCNLPTSIQTQSRALQIVFAFSQAKKEIIIDSNHATKHTRSEIKAQYSPLALQECRYASRLRPVSPRGPEGREEQQDPAKRAAGMKQKRSLTSMRRQPCHG